MGGSSSSSQKKGSAQYGTYTPFTEFPTPDLLAKAQRDYTAANVEHKLDDKGIPLPFPPTTTKSQVFKPDDYRDIDRHAIEAPFEEARKSYESFTAYLTKKSENEIGKVRAFFVWIANQGVQKVRAYQQQYGVPTHDSPMTAVYNIVMQRRAGSYPVLLARMCSEAGIPNRVVTNDKVKGVNYHVGDETIEGCNTHCLVYVDKSWRIIDQHWGSQSVVIKADADWEYLAGRKTLKPEDVQQLFYHCDEFYFLTDPEAYVYKNWAASRGDVLLARPVAEREFIEMAHLHHSYFDFGFTSIGPAKCVIVAREGTTFVTIGIPNDKKIRFNYTLYKSKFLPKYNEVNGIPLDRYVQMERTNDKTLKVTVDLPQFGKHKFELHCGLESENTDSVFCEYVIDCKKPNTIAEPVIVGSTKTWGLTNAAAACGIISYRGDNTTVIAKNGRAEIKFNLVHQNNKRFSYTHQVWSEQVKKEEMRNYVRHYVSNDTLSVLVDLPKQDQYVYELYGKDENNRQELHLASYIIRSDRGLVDIYSYPRSDGPQVQQMGDLVARDEIRYLDPDTHPNPLILWENERELEIRMKILKTAIFTASLKFSNEDRLEFDCSDCLHSELADQGINFFMKFSKIGMYKLTIQADDKKVYQYVIRVKMIGSDSFPFPKFVAPKLVKGFQLLQPRSKYLSCNDPVRFQLKLMNASSVIVTGGREPNVQLTTTGKTGIWEATVTTGPDPGDIKVFAQTDKTEMEHLLTYQVMSEEDMYRLSDEHSRSTKRVEIQQERERKKAEKAAKEADDREKAKLEKQKQDDEYFKKNERKFEKKEEEILQEERTAREAEEKNHSKFSDEKTEENLTEEEVKKKIEDETEDANNRKQKWESMYASMRYQIVKEKMRQSAIAGNFVELADSIDELESFGKEEDEMDIEDAKVLLRVLLQREELKSACAKEDVAEIKGVLKKIRDRTEEERNNEIEKALDLDIKEAERLIKRLTRKRQIRPFEMDRKALSEIKTYSNPKSPMHSVMKAALLLLGQSENKTREWKNCQVMLKSNGKDSLLNKIVLIKVDKLNPEVCARSKELLSTVSETELERSAGVAAFYSWSMGVIEEAALLNNWDKEFSFTFPATVARQKEIFEEQRKDDELENTEMNRRKNDDVKKTNEKFDDMEKKKMEKKGKKKKQENEQST